MALRIGAFLLASYNFVSAALVPTHGHTHAVYKGDRPEPSPVPGVGVKSYAVGAKNCDKGPNCKTEVKVHVVKDDGCKGDVVCVKRRYRHTHGDGHSHEKEHGHGHVYYHK